MTSPAVVAHETGKIDATAFAAGVVADLMLPITGQSFLRDFCSWPTGLLPGALELLDEIPGTYRLSALSNTSAVHWNRIGAMGLASRFSQTYLSYQIGHLKPTAEAFQVAIAGMGLHPEEVLFLDDGVRNIEAAKALGMCAHVALAPEDARSVLVDYGVLG
jgi:putative hydrolase of the HAD superfamily